LKLSIRKGFDMLNHGKNAYALLGILQSHAPTSKEQEMCTNLYNTMQKDGFTWKEIETELVSALIDGLRHGNWFWLINEKG
jgi:hypothetical protein